jgi:hypothetical protein
MSGSIEMTGRHDNHRAAPVDDYITRARLGLDPGSARRLMWHPLWQRTIRVTSLSRKSPSTTHSATLTRDAPPVAHDGTGGGSVARR